MPQFRDLYELEEDERIEQICKAADAGQHGAVIVETREKAARYIGKIQAKGSRFVCGPVLAGPTAHCVTFTVASVTKQ